MLYTIILDGLDYTLETYYRPVNLTKTIALP